MHQTCRNFAILSIFFLLITFGKLSLSSELAVVLAEQPRVSLQPHLSWYFDPSGKLDAENVLNESDLFEASPNKVNLERTTGAYWLYFSVHLPIDSVQKKWVMELAYTQLDRIDVYVITDTALIQHQQRGDAFPVSQQENYHTYPVFSLPLERGKTSDVYLRIQSSTSINVPLTLWQYESYAKHERQNLLISGIVYGVFIGLIFYNLFLYPTVRNSVYLWFALYLVSFSIFQFSMEGYARLYFWPEWPALADRAVTFSLWLTMASGLRFTQYMANAQHYSPRINQLISGMVIFSLIVAITILLTGPAITFPLLAPFGILVALIIPIPLIVSVRAGYSPARFALLAFFPVFPGALLISMRSMGVVDPTFWTEHALSIGAAVSAVLLSFALADRINFLREEKTAFHSQLLRSEREVLVAKKEFSNQLIQAQDEERRRLASELHDGVGQNLSFLSNALKKLEKKPDKEVLHTASEITREAVNEIRFISHQLHPHILDQLGLIAAIESIAERVEEQTQVRCNVEADITLGDLDKATQLHIYRIVQESLNNAIKHSHANLIDVQLSRQEKNISLSIIDNGKGLTQSKASLGQELGLGLESIKHRVNLCEGKLEFKPNIPHGLIIYISLPIRELI